MTTHDNRSRPSAITAGTIVTPARVLAPGTVRIDHDGHIADVHDGTDPDALDVGHDRIVVPGGIDVHTDILEDIVQPRPGAQLPLEHALAAYERRLLAAGITTSFAAICLGELGLRDQATTRALLTAIADRNGGIDHRVHLRIEVSDPEATATARDIVAAGTPRIDLASLMDHTPGQGQFADPAAYLRFFQRSHGDTANEVRARLAHRRTQSAEHLRTVRKEITDALAPTATPIACHDPDSPDQIDEAAQLGVSIAEFPTTMTAAAAARRHHMLTVMGAPNMLRGRSSCGNLSATDAHARGLVDVLTSDYQPETLWPAALSAATTLPEAVDLVSRQPAKAVKLDHDRGTITPTQRADLVVLGRQALPLMTIVRGRITWWTHESD